jgi:hypothetical protein
MNYYSSHKNEISFLFINLNDVLTLNFSVSLKLVTLLLNKLEINQKDRILNHEATQTSKKTEVFVTYIIKHKWEKSLIH